MFFIWHSFFLCNFTNRLWNPRWNRFEPAATPSALFTVRNTESWLASRFNKEGALNLTLALQIKLNNKEKHGRKKSKTFVLNHLKNAELWRFRFVGKWAAFPLKCQVSAFCWRQCDWKGHCTGSNEGKKKNNATSLSNHLKTTGKRGVSLKGMTNIREKERYEKNKSHWNYFDLKFDSALHFPASVPLTLSHLSILSFSSLDDSFGGFSRRLSSGSGPVWMVPRWEGPGIWLVCPSASLASRPVYPNELLLPARPAAENRNKFLNKLKITQNATFYSTSKNKYFICQN